MENATAVLGRRFFEEQDRLRSGPAAELCSPAYTATLGGNPAMNRDGHEQFARAFYAAFPDMRHTIEDVFASGNRVAVRFVIHGTDTGGLFGMPPTNRPVTIAAHVLMHIDAGKVGQLFGIFDEAGLLRQLGALQ